MLASSLPKHPQPHLQVAAVAPGEKLAIVALIEPEPARAAGEPVTAIARDHTGRLILFERAGATGHKIGPTTTMAEARTLALKVLDGHGPSRAAPDTLFKIALAFVAAGVAAAGAGNAKPRRAPTADCRLPTAAPPAQPEARS